MRTVDEHQQVVAGLITGKPPIVLPIAETRLVTAMADATIFVARWRYTPDHAIKAALRLLPPKYVNVVGVVLSRINMKKQGSYGRGDASYYYQNYKEYYA